MDDINAPIIPHTEATRSALTHWSWYDVARTVGGGLLGALAGAVLTVWMAPDADGPWPWLRRLLVAAMPITLGMCLVEGHLRRARTRWLRCAGEAAAWAVAGCLPLAALAAWQPAASLVWGLCAVVASAAFARGFRAARHGGQSLLAGLLAGAALAAFLSLAPPVQAPGTLGRWLQALSVLLPLGGLLGLGHGIVRELGKRRWLLVLFGDHPGRHYPIYDTPFTLGTAPENALVLDATGGVLPHHATIRREGSRVVVAPEAPGAVVALCDRRAGVSELFDGNDLQIGETVVRYYTVPDR